MYDECIISVTHELYSVTVISAVFDNIYYTGYSDILMTMVLCTLQIRGQGSGARPGGWLGQGGGGGLGQGRRLRLGQGGARTGPALLPSRARLTVCR